MSDENKVLEMSKLDIERAMAYARDELSKTPPGKIYKPFLAGKLVGLMEADSAIIYNQFLEEHKDD